MGWKSVEERRAYEKAYYAANKERRLASTRKWRANNPDKKLMSDRKTKGLPEPTRPCPSVCECCGKPCFRELNLDHDHTNGQFRGWLCAKCNTGIGKLGDSIEGLERALAYLKRTTQSDT